MKYNVYVGGNQIIDIYGDNWNFKITDKITFYFAKENDSERVANTNDNNDPSEETIINDLLKEPLIEINEINNFLYRKGN